MVLQHVWWPGLSTFTPSHVPVLFQWCRTVLVAARHGHLLCLFIFVMCAYFPSFFPPFIFLHVLSPQPGLLSKQACLKGSAFPWVEWQDTPADVFAAATSPFMPFYLFKSPTL